jgi:hypothetical protein
MTELKQRGFNFVEDRAKADFEVGFSLGWHGEGHAPNNPYAQVDASGWGYRGERQLEGRLAINIYDVKLRKPVWQGFASKHINDSDRGNVEVINKAVAAILKSFPPS